MSQSEARDVQVSTGACAPCVRAILAARSPRLWRARSLAATNVAGDNRTCGGAMEVQDRVRRLACLASADYDSTAGHDGDSVISRGWLKLVELRHLFQLGVAKTIHLSAKKVTSAVSRERPLPAREFAGPQQTATEHRRSPRNVRFPEPEL